MKDTKSGSLTRAGDPDGDRPNIVLIMSDQHNARIMGCAGDKIVRTPNLDALAQGGTMFDAAYCAHPLCVPSRISFLTGYWPSRIGAVSNGSTIDSAQFTFAHALGVGGYEADLCGRMHFEGPDQFHGFEKRLYGDCVDSLTLDIVGVGRNRTNGQTSFAVEVAGHGANGFQAYDREVTAAACRRVGEQKPGDRPYCMVVGMMLPHNPLIARKDLFDYYFSRLSVPEAPPEEYLRSLHPALHAWRQRRGVTNLTPEQNHRAMAAYYALVTEMDENLGKLIGAVRQSATADNTIIIYCSDHGDMAGSQYGMWWKSSYYEGSARVPMIASWPGRIPAGRRVGANVSLIDLGPTVLDLARCPALEGIDGRSLAPFMLGGEPANWRDEIFCEYLGDHGDQPSCMIRRGQWKLNYYSEFDSFQLFDLADDPEEMNDLAQAAEHKELAGELLARIRSRWSAKEMLAYGNRQRQSWGLIHKCGHDFLPHDVKHHRAGDEANQFDFGQLPNGPELAQRRYKKQ